MFHGVNMCFNLSETLATKFTTGNDDDALIDGLTSSELVNEVGQAAHIIKALMSHIMTTLVLLLETIHETGVHLTEVYACDPGREVGSVSLFVIRNSTLFCGFRPLELHRMGRHISCRHEDASADCP